MATEEDESFAWETAREELQATFPHAGGEVVANALEATAGDVQGAAELLNRVEGTSLDRDHELARSLTLNGVDADEEDSSAACGTGLYWGLSYLGEWGSSQVSRLGGLLRHYGNVLRGVWQLSFR